MAANNALGALAPAPMSFFERYLSAWVAACIVAGLLLGWSVAWPPGPINAEMIRRGLTRGFWPAYSVGLGACTGDFLWALAVALGAGAIATLLALMLLSMAAAWGLAEVIEPGWSFLIVGALWAIAAAVLLTTGRDRLTSVEPIPETRTTVKEDIEWAKQQRS